MIDHLREYPRESELLTPYSLFYGLRTITLAHMLVTEEDLQDLDYSSTSSQMCKNTKRLSTTQPFPNMIET